MTSHFEKHHREDKDVSKNVYHVDFESCEDCHVGRDGGEVSRDVVEQRLHGDTVEDSLSAGEDMCHEVHHAGGEDGPEVQHVLGEGQEDGEHCGGVKQGLQGEEAAQEHHREEEDVQNQGSKSKKAHHVEVESYEVRHVDRDGRDVVQSLQGDTVEGSLHVGQEVGLTAVYVTGEGKQVDNQLCGGAGGDPQCEVVAQEEYVDNQLCGGTCDPQCSVHVTLARLGESMTLAMTLRRLGEKAIKSYVLEGVAM